MPAALAAPRTLCASRSAAIYRALAVRQFPHDQPFIRRLGALDDYDSSPVAATDKIYIASADKEVVVLDAGEELKVPAKNNSTVGS